MALLGKKHAKIKKKVPCMKKKAPGYYTDDGASIVELDNKVVVVEMVKYIPGYHFRGIYVGMNYNEVARKLTIQGFHLAMGFSYEDMAVL